MTGPLRIVRMRFSMPGLARFARSRGFSTRGDDLGYLVHGALKELFGKDSPGPFRTGDGDGRWITVHAYTTRTRADLEDHARAFADPAAVETCDLTSLAEKTLPESWTPGRPIGFEVRCCPVVRLSKPLSLAAGPEDGAVVAAGSEVDAFLAHAWRHDGPVDREQVYRDWLEKEMGRRGGLRPSGIRVTSMSRAAVLRRTQGQERKGRWCDRPDVTMSGTGEVLEGPAFRALLERGVGRHRAFGFGMVILRPPG